MKSMKHYKLNLTVQIILFLKFYWTFIFYVYCLQNISTTWLWSNYFIKLFNQWFYLCRVAIRQLLDQVGMGFAV